MPVGRGCYHFHWSQHPVAKSGQTVTVACKPSGRAEGQVAGAVGGAWTWPVRPAAAPAPGKPHRTLYRIAYDVV